jgi:hypothetical protein
MSDPNQFYYAKFDPKQRAYVYIVGPVPPAAGFNGGGHRALSLSDRDANSTDDLEALAIAVLRDDETVMDGDGIPEGRQMRVLRIPTPLYNSFVDQAQPAYPGQPTQVLKPTLTPGAVKARYVLRLGPAYFPTHPTAQGGWYFSEWIDQNREFNLGGHGDPGVPPPALPGRGRRGPGFFDGQHRAGSQN